MTIRTGPEQYIYIFDTHRTIIIVTSIVTNNRVFQKLPVFSSSVLESFNRLVIVSVEIVLAETVELHSF